MGYSVWVRKNEGTGQYHGVVTNGRFVNSLVMFKTAGFAERGAAYAAGVEWRNKNAAENRERKAKVDGKRMHCQCCGRAILANLGSIAHHGYERPGHGWQTSSCMGAKELPFEVDRTALGRMIEFLRVRLEGQKKHRVAIKAEKKPIVFEYSRQLIGPSRNQMFGRFVKWPVVDLKFDVTRESFEKFKSDVGSQSTYGIYDFDAYKERHVKYLTGRINNLIDHINEEQARYDGWKQTHKRENGKWVAL